MNKNKVLIIGIDGLDPYLIRKWQTDLPTLSELIENGTSGILKSSIPPLSCPAWVYFSTGKQSGKLGFTDFFIVDRKNNKIVPVNSHKIPSKFFWEILDECGIRCCIVNMPLTYPPRKLKNGVLVSGFPTPINYRESSSDNVFTYPPELSEELNSLFPNEGYEIDISDSVGFSLWSEDEIFRKLINLLRKRTKVFNYVLDKYEWDLGIVVYTEIDRASHFFYGTPKLKEIYKVQDEELRKLITKYKDSTDYIIIVSDHGFMKLDGEVYINDFLEAEGYLKYSIYSKRNVLLNISKYVPDKIIRLLIKLLPRNIQAKLPREKAPTILDTKIEKGTKIYHIGDLYFQFYLNNIGTNELNIFLNKLLELKDDKGRPIIDRIYFKNEIFRGGKIDNLPDIIARPKVGIRASSKIHQKSIIGKNTRWRGDHFEDGVHIWYGKYIKNGEIINANIVDIAPTVLHIFELPIPSDMDGRVLKEVFKENSPFAKKEIKYEDSLKTRTKEVVKKLKLGGKI